MALAARLSVQAGAAASSHLLALWLGAVIAMIAADGIAVLAGSFLGTRIRKQLLAFVSSAIFAVFGLFTLGQALLTH